MTFEKGIVAGFANLTVAERHVRATAFWKKPHVCVDRHMGGRVSLWIIDGPLDAQCGDDNTVEVCMDLREAKDLRDMLNEALGE